MAVVNAIIISKNKDLCMNLANELNVTDNLKVTKMIYEETKAISEIKKIRPKLIILDIQKDENNAINIINEIDKNNLIESKMIVLLDRADLMSEINNISSVLCCLIKRVGIDFISIEIQKKAFELMQGELEKKIFDYLFDLGFSPTSQGMFFLKETIKIFLSNNKVEFRLKELTKTISQKSHINEYKIKNNMINASKNAWKYNKVHIQDMLKLGPGEEISPKKVVTMARYYIKK